MSRLDLELSNALNLYNFIESFIREHASDDRPYASITPKLVRSLHSISFAGIEEVDAGKYRDVAVQVGGHAPVAPPQVSAEVDKLCEYVRRTWNRRSALHLAAYVLWRLNWIHPFVDGNGRAARALSYLVLSLKLGFWLPGAPTIPEQLVYHRARYFDALQKADVSLAVSRKTDLQPLESMLEDMLITQLERIPAASDDVQHELRAIVDRRIRRAPVEAIRSLFGEPILERFWSIDDHFVLQVGSPDEIRRAEQRDSEFGNPFPRLFAVADHSSAIVIGEDQRGVILREHELDAGTGYAVCIEKNSGAVIENPRVTAKNAGSLLRYSWEARGVLYALRYGNHINVENVVDAFDAIVARHVSSLAN